MSNKQLGTGYRPARPLWQRAPVQDDDGCLLSDFMMLIPKLSRAPAFRRERVCVELSGLFREHGERVHFAELNLKLNVLWISVDAVPGLIPELVAAVRERIPEAVLIGHDYGDSPRRRSVGLLPRLKDRILRLGGRRPALSRPDSETR